MSAQQVSFNRQTLRRFLRAVKDLLTSEVRRSALGLLVLLAVFALSVNGLNVVNSYVGRDFMTAIAHRDMTGFIRQAFLYVGVFAGLTAVAVFYRFCEERLCLVWRSWLTKRVTAHYLDGRTYLRLKESAEIENPDQRIADDIRGFTTSTLSFALIFLNSTLAAISFSGVLWTISPLLFGVAVGYAALGTVITLFMGRPLIGLNYAQSDREADFRATLIHVGENAESIAIGRREGRLKARLFGRIDGLIENFRRITSVNRNLGFFTTGYNYLIQIIPTLIVAPLFIRGEVEFGVITQSAMAFTQLLGAFSLIVNQFGSISTFAAVIARLGALAEAVEASESRRSSIEVVEDPDRVAFERLTLRSSRDDGLLIKDLSASIPRGMNVLVTGPNEAARMALFQAIAGIWPDGEGRITRPTLDAVLFLPQRPYSAPGTLRDVLLRTAKEHDISDAHLLAALQEAGLKSIVDRAGGLETEIDWPTKLSLGEQQQLAFIRLLLAKPTFVLLDRLSSSLSQAQVHQCLQQLTEHSISYVLFDVSSGTANSHDALLECDTDGSWQWRPTNR